MTTMLGFLCAVVLPFRFNMFILLPAIGLGWALVLFGGFLNAGSLESIALQMMLVAVILQVGYVAGILLRWALLVSRRGGWSEKTAAVSDGTY